MSRRARCCSSIPPTARRRSVNVFAQDEIALSPGKLTAILGSQDRAQRLHRLRIAADRPPALDAGDRPHRLGRRLARPSGCRRRFDTDLRFTGGHAQRRPRRQSRFSVRDRGRPRGRLPPCSAIPQVAFGVSVFLGPVRPVAFAGAARLADRFPVVLANKLSGTVSGVEVVGARRADRRMADLGGYSFLSRERSPSTWTAMIATGGALEHNDPASSGLVPIVRGPAAQFRVRRDHCAGSAALPQPGVPAYAS